MKYLLILLLFSFSALSAEFSAKNSAFNKPYDGDTLKLNLRLAHIDTPEMKGKCEYEKELAVLARDYVWRFLKENKNIQIKVIKVGYFGRPIVEIRSGERYLNFELVTRGYARVYKGKRLGWCSLDA